METEVLEKNISQDFGLLLKRFNRNPYTKIKTAVLASDHDNLDSYQVPKWFNSEFLDDKKYKESIEKLSSIGYALFNKGVENYHIYYRTFIRVNKVDNFKKLIEKINLKKPLKHSEIEDIIESFPCFYLIEGNNYFRKVNDFFGTFMLYTREYMKKDKFKENGNSIKKDIEKAEHIKIFFPSKSFVGKCYKKLNSLNYFNNPYGGNNAHHNHVMDKLGENNLHFGCGSLRYIKNPYKKCLKYYSKNN